MFTHNVSREILIENKNWQVKLWQIYGHSPIFPPAKVSLYTLFSIFYHLVKHKVRVQVAMLYRFSSGDD